MFGPKIESFCVLPSYINVRDIRQSNAFMYYLTARRQIFHNIAHIWLSSALNHILLRLLWITCNT